MKKRNLIILNILLTVFLLVLQANPISAQNYSVSDPKNDVTNIQNSAYQTMGGIHTEIDITSIVITGDTLELNFQSDPIVGDGHHCYIIDIYWNGGENSDNHTHFEVGTKFNGNEENIVTTKLYDDTHQLIADTTIDGGIYSLSKQIVFPIPESWEITNLFDPEVIIAETHADANQNNYWMDFFPDNRNTWLTGTGMGFWVICGSASIVVMVYLFKKKG